MIKRLHFGSQIRMKTTFALFLVWGVLKLGIIVHKANVFTYIWSFLAIWKITENRFYDEKIAIWS